MMPVIKGYIAVAAAVVTLLVVLIAMPSDSDVEEPKEAPVTASEPVLVETIDGVPIHPNAAEVEVNFWRWYRDGYKDGVKLDTTEAEELLARRHSFRGNTYNEYVMWMQSRPASAWPVDFESYVTSHKHYSGSFFFPGIFIEGYRDGSAGTRARYKPSKVQ